MLMVTRLMRVVTYRKDFPTINSHDPSVWWSYEITWQIKYITSPPAETPGDQNKESTDL